MTTIVLGLNSGRQITASKVMLYPAKLVEQAASLRAQAISKMGNVSTGIGFLGSPGWAIAGSMLVGAIESSVNNKNHQEGALLLQKAVKAFESAKDGGRLIDIYDIVNTNKPIPSIWRATFNYEENISFAGLSVQQIEKLCDKYEIEKTYVFKSGIFSDFNLLKENELVRWSEEFIHSGEDFLEIEESGEVLHVKWSDISTYKLAAGVSAQIAHEPADPVGI